MAGGVVDALDPRPRRVAQSDGFGPLHEGALVPRLDESEAAAALEQKVGRPLAIGEACRSAEQEHQARLVIAGRRIQRPLAVGMNIVGEQRARKQRTQQRHDRAGHRDRQHDRGDGGAQQRALRAVGLVKPPGQKSEDHRRGGKRPRQQPELPPQDDDRDHGGDRQHYGHRRP